MGNQFEEELEYRSLMRNIFKDELEYRSLMRNLLKTMQNIVAC
jgi:hypothetical protein